MNKAYQSPAILQTVTVLLEQDFLDGSITPVLEVESVGQQVEEKDFSSGEFNFEWE